VRLEGDELVINYVTERDHVWLRALLDEYIRYAEKKHSELRQRLIEPLPVAAPRHKLKIAQQVLERMCSLRERSALPPQEARRAVFTLAAERSTTTIRRHVVREAAAALGVSHEQLEDALFADLASERLLGELPQDLCPARLPEQVNLAMIGGLLARAREVRIVAHGHTRALVRQAKLVGLICVVERVLPKSLGSEVPLGSGLDAVTEGQLEAVAIHVSGPLALFRHTRIYGRALASLVPRIAWCQRYEVSAQCQLSERGAPLRVTVRSGDPLPAGRELERHDSRLERDFARAFARCAPDWDLIREPEPIAVGRGLIFPDFELRHRHYPERRWYLEIAGFWTREYLTNKLAQLRSAAIDRLLLCIDEKRCCSEHELPDGAKVIRYKRRIDAEAVLARVEAAWT
jgi:uncharacterized protein